LIVTFEAYSERIKSGSNWLKMKIKPDGSYGGQADSPAYYAKTPWALAMSGEPWTASLVGDHVMKVLLRPDGDLLIANDPPSYREWDEQHYLYSEGWLAYGLQKIGRFDVTYRMMKFIEGFRDARLGGFYSNKGRAHMDTLVTSLCGLCCLASGRLDASMKAGEFLATVLRDQKDKTRFYTALAKNGRLVKEFEEERKLYYVVEKTELDQWYFYIGLPIAFLVKLYEASGDRRFLNLATKYFAVAEGCREDVFRWNGTGKLSWGSSLLFKHLRVRKYRDAAMSILDGLFMAQKKEGGFLSLRGTYKSLNEQLLIDTIDVTAETVALGSETLQALHYAP
jgi:hypothetical protein